MNELAEELNRLANDAEIGVSASEDVEAVMVDSSHHLGQSEKAMETISKSVDKAVDLGESMESYVSGFMAAVPSGEWTLATARTYHAGMTGILQSYGLSDTSSVPSFEAVDKTETAEDYKTGAVAKAKAFFLKIMAMVRAAVKAFIDMLFSYRQKTAYRSKALKAGANELRKKIEAMNGKKDGSKVMSFIDFEGEEGKMVGLSNTNGLVDYLSREGSSVLAPSSAVESAVTEVQTNASSWFSGYKSAIDSVLSAIEKNAEPTFADAAKKTSTTTSFTLPGGRAVTFSMPGADTFSKLVKGSVDVKGFGKETGKLKMITAKDVLGIASAMDKTAEAMDSMEKTLGEMESDLKKTIDKSQAAVDKALKEGETEHAKKAAQGVAPLTTRLSEAHRKLLPVMAEYAEYAYKHALRAMNEFSTVRKMRG